MYESRDQAITNVLACSVEVYDEDGRRQLVKSWPCSCHAARVLWHLPYSHRPRLESRHGRRHPEAGAAELYLLQHSLARGWLSQCGWPNVVDLSFSL